ncbi:MAG: class I SAM-dependent methyltransferase [Cyclobacteriaceae bacterium]
MTKEWLYYWLLAVDEHSLQSPFIFSFYQRYIKNGSYEKITQIEQLRKALHKDHTLVEVNDFGAGSTLNNQQKRKVSYIAKTSASRARFSLFLRDLIIFEKYQNVLELGTSLGINTLYMASDNTNPELLVHTIEGSRTIAQLAVKNFEHCDQTNIRSHIGNIDDVLPTVLTEMKSVDLAYLDANHTLEATLDYFRQILPYTHENSTIVVDDIHWSGEMKTAWETLKLHEQVTTSVDLFDAGMLFFRSGLRKNHHIIEF